MNQKSVFLIESKENIHIHNSTIFLLHKMTMNRHRIHFYLESMQMNLRNRPNESFQKILHTFFFIARVSFCLAQHPRNNSQCWLLLLLLFVAFVAVLVVHVSWVWHSFENETAYTNEKQQKKKSSNKIRNHNNGHSLYSFQVSRLLWFGLI